MRLLETARFQPVHCSSDFILYSWIYLFLCWVYPAHDSMKCRLLLLFCDHKKNSSFISTRSVRLTFCFPLSGSVLFYVNKILNKVYPEHWFSSCSWWINRGNSLHQILANAKSGKVVCDLYYKYCHVDWGTSRIVQTIRKR